MFRFLIDYVHAIDSRPARPVVGELNEPLNGVLVPLEHGFDGSVGAIPDPAIHTVLLSDPARRIAKEHALNEPVDDDAAANRHEP